MVGIGERSACRPPKVYYLEAPGGPCRAKPPKGQRRAPRKVFLTVTAYKVQGAKRIKLGCNPPGPKDTEAALNAQVVFAEKQADGFHHAAAKLVRTRYGKVEQPGWGPPAYQDWAIYGPRGTMDGRLTIDESSSTGTMGIKLQTSGAFIIVDTGTGMNMSPFDIYIFDSQRKRKIKFGGVGASSLRGQLVIIDAPPGPGDGPPKCFDLKRFSLVRCPKGV